MSFVAKPPQHAPLILFPTRFEMLQKLVAPGATILEIGVFAGQFAAQLQLLAPEHLFLCDPWDGISISGDQDGNNVVACDLREAYKHLKGMERGDSTLHLIRGRSPEALKGLADATFDLIYVDGDHSYEGCAADLEAAWRLVRPGGLICGHDYEVNPAKTDNRYDFGVKRAVDEFCAQHGLSICAKGMDGCVSYAIRAPAAKNCAPAAQ